MDAFLRTLQNTNKHRRNLGVWDEEFKTRNKQASLEDATHAKHRQWVEDQLQHQCFIDGRMAHMADVDRQLGNPMTAGAFKNLLERLSREIKVERHPYWTNTWTVSIPRRLERVVFDSRAKQFTNYRLEYLCAFDGPVVPEFTVMTTKMQDMPSVQRHYEADDPMIRHHEIPWHVQNPGWRSVLAKLVIAEVISADLADREASKLSAHSHEAWQALLGKSPKAQQRI